MFCPFVFRFQRLKTNTSLVLTICFILKTNKLKTIVFRSFLNTMPIPRYVPLFKKGKGGGALNIYFLILRLILTGYDEKGLNRANQFIRYLIPNFHFAIVQNDKILNNLHPCTIIKQI